MNTLPQPTLPENTLTIKRYCSVLEICLALLSMGISFACPCCVVNYYSKLPHILSLLLSLFCCLLLLPSVYLLSNQVNVSETDISYFICVLKKVTISMSDIESFEFIDKGNKTIVEIQLNNKTKKFVVAEKDKDTLFKMLSKKG